MKKLILHIGSHKTGTTSLQLALKANKANLQKQGVSYFCEKPNGEEEPEGNANRWVVFENHDPFSAKIADGFASNLSSLEGTVLVSSEEMSWLFDQKEILRLKEELSRFFSDIKIVTYLRRQEALAISHYQQASKDPYLKTAKFYGDTISPLPKFSPHLLAYLDYNQRLSLWAEAFGKDNLIVRVFQKDVLEGGNIIDDFKSTFGFELAETVKEQNVSYSSSKTRLNLLMNKAFVHPKHRGEINKLFEGGTGPLPSRKEAEQFYKQFEDSNKTLNKTFNISAEPAVFSADFSKYPEETNFNWTQDEMDDVLLKVLSSYKSISELHDKAKLEQIRLGIQVEKFEKIRSYWPVKIVLFFKSLLNKK